MPATGGGSGPLADPAPVQTPVPLPAAATPPAVEVRPAVESHPAVEEKAFAVPRSTPEMRAELETLLLDESNRFRTSEGMPPLVRDSRLDRAARLFAEELARRGELDHESTVAELRTPELRAAAEGARERFVGETLALLAARPQDAPRRTVVLWSGSPDHRRVLLRGVYRRAGIGVAMDEERVWYVVQMYAPGG